MRLLMSASALALCLALGAPAQAQQTAPSPPQGKAQQMTPSPSQGKAQQQAQFSKDQFNQILQRAGVQQLQEFQGKLFRAQTQDGHPVFMFVGPEDLAGGETVDIEDTQVRNALQQAQFQSIRPLEDVYMFRGQLDDKGVLAVSGQRNWEGQPGQARQQLSQQAIQQQLQRANIEDLEPFQGTLVRAETQQGNTVFVIVGPRDMSGGEMVDSDQNQLRQRLTQSLQRATLQDIQFLSDGVHMFRGTLEGNAVLAMAGNLIETPRAGFGAGGAPEPGMKQGPGQQPTMPRQK